MVGNYTVNWRGAWVTSHESTVGTAKGARLMISFSYTRMYSTIAFLIVVTFSYVHKFRSLVPSQHSKPFTTVVITPPSPGGGDGRGRNAKEVMRVRLD
jgi:hypothetical protein